jgi:hypothetical protein
MRECLEANNEKRRLTIDWRGSMMTQSELIDATARRVGFSPPRIDDTRKQHEKDFGGGNNNTKKE